MAFPGNDFCLPACLFSRDQSCFARAGISAEKVHDRAALPFGGCRGHVIWQIWRYLGLALVGLLPDSHADNGLVAAFRVETEKD